MLLRSASHGITPAITLDFLIPRTILWRKASQAATRNSLLVASDRARRGSSKAGQPSTAASQASQPSAASSSTPTTPGQVLSKLQEDVGVFDEQHLTSLTRSQTDAFNGAIPALRNAIRERDFTKASDIWRQIRDANLLAHLGPAHYDICSTAVEGRAKAGGLNEEEEQLLHHIALVCAAGGSTNGLRALMLAAVKDERPKDALALYERYFDIIRGKEALNSVKLEHPGEEVADEAASSDAESTVSLSAVRPDILSAAMAAYARIGSARFPEALHTYLQADIRITHAVRDQALHHFFFEHARRTQVASYVRRIKAASLLARPQALKVHLSNLTRDSADAALERLYTTVIAGASEPDPWLAMHASELSERRVVLLPDFFWATSLASFLACRRTDLAEKLWDDMLKHKVKPDIAAWNALLDGYGNLRSLDAVLKTWEVMLAQGVKPDAFSYRAIISAFFTAGRPDDALSRFHAFERDYLKNAARARDPGVLAVYNTTLHGLLFVSRLDEAQIIKKKMEESGPKPDIVTYNTFLRYYGRKGELKTMAQVLQELEPAGVKADVYTFSTLLSSMIKTRPDAAQIVLNFMKKQGVLPDTTTLTAIIDHQLEERTPQSFKVAMDLLSQMERGEFGDAVPSAITYTSVLTAINRADWLGRVVVEEYTQRIWESMQSRGFRPGRTAYNVVLRAALGSGEPEGLESAMKYYRDMLRERVHISADTWYILLKGLADRKQWEMAGEVVKDMRRHKATDFSHSLQRLVNVVSKRNGMSTAGSW